MTPSKRSSMRLLVAAACVAMCSGVAVHILAQEPPPPQSGCPQQRMYMKDCIVASTCEARGKSICTSGNAKYPTNDNWGCEATNELKQCVETINQTCYREFKCILQGANCVMDELVLFSPLLLKATHSCSA